MSSNVSQVELAETPEDGGKWAIYCEHTNAAGEISYTAILQDSNKKRLAQWRNYSTEWCAGCRTESEAAQ